MQWFGILENQYADISRGQSSQGAGKLWVVLFLIKISSVAFKKDRMLAKQMRKHAMVFIPNIPL